MPATCPACGAPSDAPECARCRASLDATGAANLTLVTRHGDDAGTPRASRLTLSGTFRARYRLERVLGAGAMGMVYAGVQLSTGRPVAVKFHTRVESPDLRARFVQEGRLLARISHPYVLRILELGDEDEHPFLVTELLPGETLRTRLEREKRLEAAPAVALAAQLLAALAECHAAGIVHRDIKPENVLLDADGAPRLADFGLARSIDGASLTRTGALVGTPRYMPPEQAMGEHTGAAADLYALSCMVFELIAGEPPFCSITLSDLLVAHAVEPPPALETRVPEGARTQAPVLAAVGEVLARGMAKKPDQRPASAAAMAEELKLALRGRARGSARRSGGVRSSGSFPGATSAPPAGSRLRSPRVLATALAIGLVAGLAGGLAPRPDAPPPRAPATASATPEPARAPADPGRSGRLGGAGAFHPYLSAVGVSADGARIALGGRDGVVRIHERGGRLAHAFATGAALERIAFAPDGTVLTLGRPARDDDPTAVPGPHALRPGEKPGPGRWTPSGERAPGAPPSFAGPAPATAIPAAFAQVAPEGRAIALSADGAAAAFVRADGTLALWRADRDFTPVQPTLAVPEPKGAHFSAAGSTLVVLAAGRTRGDRRAMVIDVREARHRCTRDVQAGDVAPIDRDRLMIVNRRVFRETPACGGQAGPTFTMSFASDVAADATGMVHVRRVALSPSGLLIAGSEPALGQVAVFDARTGQAVSDGMHSMQSGTWGGDYEGSHFAPLVLFLRDERTVVMAGRTGDLHFRSLPSMDTGRKLRGPARKITAIALDRDEKFAAAAFLDGRIAVWELRGNRAIGTISTCAGRADWLALDPRRRRVLSIGRDGALCAWPLPGF